MTNDEDDARRIILARRARFVAAALAGAGIATASCESSPQPCLDIVGPGDQYSEPDASESSGGRGGGAGGAGDAAVPDAAVPDAAVPDAAVPLPCLSIPAADRDDGQGS